VSTKPENKSSLLAPVIGVYEPTEADADRIFANVEAVLDAGPGPSAPSSPSTAPFSRGKSTLFIRLSCVAVAIVATMAFRAARDVSNPPPATAPLPIHGLPRADATAEPNTEPQGEARDALSIPSVAVNTLPNVASAATTSQAVKRPAASTPSLPQGAPATDSDTLEKEARVLADARTASRYHDEARALALLDEHARMFPNGWLANEREAERILVLCRMGRQAEATRAGAVFLEGRPKGPLTQRVEMSCAVSPPTKAVE
jgi:hypothetical protein